jgi:hypothetical protein
LSAQYYSSEESAEENEDLMTNEKGKLYSKESSKSVNADLDRKGLSN